MTKKDKQKLIAQVVALLNELIEVAEGDSKPVPEVSVPVEMLTIKECTEAVKGLSEHTIRQLAPINMGACIKRAPKTGRYDKIQYAPTQTVRSLPGRKNNDQAMTKGHFRGKRKMAETTYLSRFSPEI